MLIQCNIERVPPSPTEVVFDKIRYLFEDNGEGQFVCEVNNLDHRKRFLEFKPDYVVFGQSEEEEEVLESQDENPSSSLNYKWPTNAPAINESGEVSGYVKEKLDEDKAKEEKAEKEAEAKAEVQAKEEKDKTSPQKPPPTSPPLKEAGPPQPASSYDPKDPVQKQKRLQEVYDYREKDRMTFPQIAEVYGIHPTRAGQFYREAKNKFEKKEK